MAKRLVRRYLVTVVEILPGDELPEVTHQAVGPRQTRDVPEPWFDRQDRVKQREKRLRKRTEASKPEA